MRANALLFGLVLFLLSACSGSGGSGSGPDNEAQKRWPEKGTYSISLTYNGCTDRYNFGSKAEYCIGLTDERLSKCNIRSLRKRAYENECGNDFEPRNISGFYISGYDSDLEKYCEINSPDVFARVADLCNFLVDEARYGGCFWEARRRKFSEYNCSQQFPPKPDVVIPEPEPPTHPEEPRPPAKTPLSLLIEKYAALGIKLTVTDRPIPPLPGKSSFHTLLEKFVPIMHELADEFADRNISSILLTQYTSSYYLVRGDNAKEVHLSVDVESSRDDMFNYLLLHDIRDELINNSGVVIDFGIVAHQDKKGDRFAYLKEGLRFFSSHLEDLKRINSLVKEILIGESHYLTFFDHSYELTRESYQSQFRNGLPLLKKLSNLTAHGIEFGRYVPINTETQIRLEEFSNFAARYKSGFIDLKEVLKGLKIDLRYERDAAPYIYSSSQLLTLGIKNGLNGEDKLSVLLSIAPLIRDLHAEMEIVNYELGSEFVAGAKLLQQRRTKLLSLKSKIETVKFTSGQSSFSYGTLRVGGQSSLSEFDKVLNSIR